MSLGQGEAVMLRYWPVPLSGISCGEPGALLLTESDAEMGPVTVGSNSIELVQLAPAGSGE
jgi:hypothetical protein